MRLDKWLFYARLYNSRKKSKEACQEGNILVNKMKKENSFNITKKDLITFIKNNKIKVIQVVTIPKNRISPKNKEEVYRII